MALSHQVHRIVRTFDCVDHFLAVSEFGRAKHIAAGLMAPEAITVKPNFAWPTARRLGTGEEFLFVGRLSSEKGLDTVVSAFAGSRYRLRVVGDGPDRSFLESRAGSNIEFSGAVAADTVGTTLRHARAVLVPSRCYEGQPRAVLEAFAAGVPVIASDIGGLPELVEDGVNGYLVPPHDVAAWRDALGRLDDDAELQRLSNGAYETWRARFSPAVAIGNLAAAYRSAIEASTRDSSDVSSL